MELSIASQGDKPTERIEQEWTDSTCWRGRRGGLLLILSAYLFLAFYRIGHQSLWFDEVRSLESARESLFSYALWFRGQGPLYFVLLHLWVQAATSEVALRSLSVIFGTIAIYLTYMVSLRMCGERVARIGALLLATSPFFIWYSQEVRYITLMMATSLLAMYAFQRAVSADRPRLWAFYGCSLILAYAAFVANILLAVMHGLYLLTVRSPRPVLRKWALCQTVVFILFLWWANGGEVWNLGGYCLRLVNEVTVSDKQKLDRASERLASGNAKREFTPAVLPYSFFVFSAGFSLGPSVRELHISRSLTALTPHAPALLTLSVLFGSLFLLGAITLRRRPEASVLLALWLTVPILGVVMVSALTAMAFNVRYVSMVLPAYVLILAIGIAGRPQLVTRTSLLVVVLSVHGLSLANYYFNPRYAREDARAAVRYLASVSQPRDAILLVGKRTALQYYQREGLLFMLWNKSVINDRAAIAGRLSELSKDYDRLWVVTIRPWEVDPQGQVKAALDDAYAITEQKQFAGIDIYRYQLSSAWGYRNGEEKSLNDALNR